MNLSSLWLLPAFLIGVLGTWFGVKQKVGVEYVKASFPLYLAGLVLNTLLNQPNLLKGGVFAGLLFCVVADFLLGKRDNRSVFIYGLAGFLGGYLLYGIFFLMASWILLSRLPSVFWGLAFLLTLVGLAQFFTFNTLPKALTVPVVFYIGVVSFFLASATSYAFTAQKYFAFLGALLIYISDSLIAHNLFRSPLIHSDLWILPPYYLGQIFIVFTTFST